MSFWGICGRFVDVGEEGPEGSGPFLCELVSFSFPPLPQKACGKNGAPKLVVESAGLEAQRFVSQVSESRPGAPELVVESVGLEAQCFVSQVSESRPGAPAYRESDRSRLGLSYPKSPATGDMVHPNWSWNLLD